MLDQVTSPIAHEVSMSASTTTQGKSKIRVETVDIIRGFALLGILFINIMTFRSTETGWSGVDHAVNTLSLILGQGKFVMIFMILFGLSFTFQVENAPPQRFSLAYVRRIGALILLGVLHFTLLWEGDILMQYVVPGFLLLFFAHRSARTILVWTGLFYGLMIAFVLVVVIATASQRVGQSIASQDPTVPASLYQTGTYGELVQARFELLPNFIGEHLVGSVLVFGNFLLGAYIGKRKLLNNVSANRPLLRRIVMWGLPVGILMNTAAILGQPYRNDVQIPLQLCIYLSTLFGPVVLALAYIAGVALLSQTVTWLRFFAPVGRMTLTNYLVQSLILTVVFYGYGLGLYDKVGPTLGIGLIVAVFMAQVLFSAVWMRHFRYGPIEWIWRSITYWRFEPIRKGTRTS